MKGKSKNFWIGIIGLCAFIVFWLMASLLLKGAAWLGDVVYPWLSLIFGIAFWIFILILLPLAFFRKTRPFSGISIYVVSFVFGAYLWITSFLITYNTWGLVVVIIGILIMGIGVVPIAMLAMLFHGEWWIFAQLVFLLIMTFGLRILSHRLAEKADEERASAVLDEDLVMYPPKTKNKTVDDSIDEITEEIAVKKSDAVVKFNPKEKKGLIVRGLNRLLSQKTILVVDDDKHIHQLICDEIKNNFGDEIKTISFYDGKPAFEYLRNNLTEVDLIISCIIMPELDGVKLLRMVKELRPRLPFIIFSALDYPDDVAVWAAEAYIVKGVDLSELLNTIKKILNIEETEEGLAVETINLGATLSPGSSETEVHMAEEPVDEFAEILIQHSQELADVRSESSLIPLDKYAHLRDFAQMLVFDCYSTTTLEKESGEINDKQFHETFFEYLYFFIHRHCPFLLLK